MTIAPAPRCPTRHRSGLTEQQGRSSSRAGRHLRIIGPAVVLPLLLLACGSDSKSGGKASVVSQSTSSASQTTPASADVAAGSQATAPVGNSTPTAEAPLADACTLLTTETVSATFSTKAHGPKAQEDAIGAATCEWTWLDPVQAPCSVTVTPRELRRFDNKSADAVEISGVGDAAYREPKNDDPNNVYMRKGGSFVHLKMRCNGDEGKVHGFTTQRQDALNTLARAVADKL